MPAKSSVTTEQVEGTESSRPLRADAQRNRAKILDAAEAVFAAQGIDVPIDVIAETAGVGVGTVYRHFPTKERLFESIMVERVMSIVREGRSRLDTQDPHVAFFDFVRYFVAEVQLKRDLMSAFETAGVDMELIAATAKQELNNVVDDLFAAAQRAGSARSDVSGPTVFSLIGATCMAAKNLEPNATIDGMLTVLFDGLRIHT